MLADKFWKIFMSHMIDALDKDLDDLLFGVEEDTAGRQQQYKRKDPFEEFEEKYARYQQYQQKRYEQFYQQYSYQQNDYKQSSFTKNTATKSVEARYYAYLELQPGASFEDIRKAYKKLMKQYHPDRFYQDEKKRQIAEEVCRKLNEAYTYFEKKHKVK